MIRVRPGLPDHQQDHRHLPAPVRHQQPDRHRVAVHLRQGQPADQGHQHRRENLHLRVRHRREPHHRRRRRHPDLQLRQPDLHRRVQLRRIRGPHRRPRQRHPRLQRRRADDLRQQRRRQRHRELHLRRRRPGPGPLRRTATGITYGLAGPGGVPRVQSYTPALSARPVYVLHDQHGTPLGSLQNGNAASYITDNLGSVTNIISSAGTTTVTYTYDPYGNSTSSAGTGQPTANQIGYTGALTDPAGYFASDGIASTGWTHLGQRWQNPATATFTQQDNLSQLANPANGNRYAYAADNPVNYVDPTGASLCQYAVGAVWTAAGLAATLAIPTVGFSIFAGFVFLGITTLVVNSQCG